MNRRTVLKNLALVSGGLVALPAWAREWTLSDVAAYPTSFSVTEQQLLASVADTIIPAGNTIGALSVGVDKFLERLLNDCYEKEVQENVKVQLAALDKAAQQQQGKSFNACNQQQRQALLLTFSSPAGKPQKDFFDLMKAETIRGFNTSKEVMTKYLNYKVAPGHYQGCVPVKPY